jgi:hypothetical protein
MPAKASKSLKTALQLIATERGKRERSPPLPRSPHKRGAITRWKNRLEGRGKIGKKSKEFISRYYQKLGMETEEGGLRPYLFADGQNYSMARGLGFSVNDLLFNFMAKLDENRNGGKNIPNASPSIFDGIGEKKYNKMVLDVSDIAEKETSLARINQRLRKWNMRVKYIW